MKTSGSSEDLVAQLREAGERFSRRLVDRQQFLSEDDAWRTRSGRSRLIPEKVVHLVQPQPARYGHYLELQRSYDRKAKDYAMFAVIATAISVTALMADFEMGCILTGTLATGLWGVAGAFQDVSNRFKRLMAEMDQ